LKMSSLDLNLSPRKKRRVISADDNATTPKRLRVAAFSTPTTSTKPIPLASLPTHLARLHTIQSSLQHALSVALATSAVSPCTDTGRVPNVLTHFSLTTSMGFTHNCDLNDLRRLCWLWEWEGEALPSKTKKKRNDDDENPFVVSDMTSSEWTRGAMGLIISPTTHLIRVEGKRVSAYGIGIEVEMDLAEGKTGGMAAVARWTAEGEVRRNELERKLYVWVKLNESNSVVPDIPLADLPGLPAMGKLSPFKLFGSSRLTSSPTKGSPADSSAKSVPIKKSSPNKDFAVPFPVTPQTPFTSPSKHSRILDPLGTPIPQTPSRQTGDSSVAVPATPTSSRRAALYERIRQKSLSSATPNATPTKNGTISNASPKDKFLQLSREETRRRLLLGRLEQVAATVWALFSSPVQTASTPLSVARKRRSMPMDEVIRAVVSSSSIPVSTVDAHDSLTLLMNLCPFFLKPLVISDEDWVEMPSSNPASISTPPSPRSKEESGHEVLHRSPKTVKMERGGLREVRERIRREQDEY